MSDRKRLYLIDGTALVYRAYFAFMRNPLVSSKGENTSASFGFTSALLKVLREERPEYLAVVFDSPKPTFRHERYPDYKATRERMPEELVAQLPRIDAIVEALDLPIIRMDRYEADDLIGTLSVQAVAGDLDVVLVTGDKDLMQLVNDRVTMLSPGRTRDDWDRITEDDVVKKWGVGPNRITDLLGLTGDTSDNIPGVPKVGEKTAAKLIGEYGSLEAVLEAAPSMKQSALQSNLTQYADQARLSKELATIALDAPVEIELGRFAWTKPRFELLRPLFRELEFFEYLKELDPEGEQAAGRANYVTVTRESLPDLCRKLREAGRFAFDTETTSTDPFTAKLVGISVACDDETGYYIPIAHRPPGKEGELDFGAPADLPENVPLASVKECLGPMLAEGSIPKIGQNVKFDLVVLEGAGFSVSGPLSDTMIASYVLDPAGRHGLDAMAQQHLGHRMIPISDLIGKGKSQITFDQTPVDRATEYSGEDALMTWRLAHLFRERLEEAKLSQLFETVEMPLMRVLLTMEKTGITIDTAILAQLSKELTGQLSEIEQRVYDTAGDVFNINSTQQLGHILFDVIGLPSKRKTKTGYSTDVDVLESLAPFHPLPKLILEYRTLSKLLSTYTDALPKYVNRKTRRVHTSFQQTVAATGRLASSEPNLQNIPIRTELGGQVRRAFVPHQGWKLVSADYSQIELRIMAHLSDDEMLIDAFRRDADIHTLTAALVFRIEPEHVNRELRAQAKTINFGVIYGQTAFGLAQQLGIPQREAQNFIDNYFATYPGVKRYSDQVIEKARAEGFVTTMLGRRRYLPEMNSSDINRRRFAERTAVNTPIQGTAADMIKVAMIGIDRRLREDRFEGKMLLQVHDELLFECPPDEVERLTEMVRTEMSGALTLKVPVRVDIGVGDNWLDAH